MRLFGNLGIAARPDVKLWSRLPPLRLDLAADSSAEIAIGPVEIEVAEIPVSLRVPFKKHEVVVARVGPFRAKLRPSHVSVRDARARISGTIESDEGGFEASLIGNCSADLNVTGNLHKRHEGDAPCEAGGPEP